MTNRKLQMLPALAVMLLGLLLAPGCLIVSDNDGRQHGSCNEDCYDYQVCDTYCDAWSCWEECWWETSCSTVCEETYDGNNVTPPATGCSNDSECGEGKICVADTCEPRDTDNNGFSGLCQTCETDADCAENGAICLRLNFDSVSRTGEKVCGRGCERNDECPAGFECAKISDAVGVSAQCIPIKGNNDKRTCNPSPDLACVKATDCLAGESCVNNACVGPDNAECSSNLGCNDGETCRHFKCVPDSQPECVDRTDCAADQVCIDGSCEGQSATCIFNEECDGDAKCVDGSCVAMCSGDDACGPNERCRQGLCEQIGCRRSADCGAGEICVDATCTPSCNAETKAGCDAGFVCNNFGYCEKDPNVACRANHECGRDEICDGGECKAACSCNQQCPDGQVCEMASGTCNDPNVDPMQPPATSCMNDCDCPSGQACGPDSTCI